MNRKETNPEGMLDRVIGEIRDERIVTTSSRNQAAVSGTGFAETREVRAAFRAAPISRR